MNTLVMGIVILVAWLGIKIIFRLIRYLESAIIATGSILVAALTLYALIISGLI